jgi:hypothetical protein
MQQEIAAFGRTSDFEAFGSLTVFAWVWALAQVCNDTGGGLCGFA